MIFQTSEQLENTQPKQEEEYLLAKDGTVYITWLQSIRVLHNFDIFMYPFDTQEVHINFGEWMKSDK